LGGGSVSLKAHTGQYKRESGHRTITIPEVRFEPTNEQVKVAAVLSACTPKVPVLISIELPVVLNEIFHGLPQSLQIIL
jgi:hypothetical protein